MTFSEAVALINSKSAIELFGKEADAQDKRYKALMKVCHPDKHTDPKKKALAEHITAKLNQLYTQLTTTPATKKQVVGNWIVETPLCKGEIADLHNVVSTTPEQISAILKVARSESDNDLLDREKTVLTHLKKEAKTNNYIHFIPSLMDSLMVGDCRANVLSVANECYTLTQLKQLLGPIDPRHLVWMMNRLLSLLGYIHRCGIVHGGIQPDHTLYRPSDHGLIVVGWGCSVQNNKGQHIPYISKQWEKIYTGEVKKKLALPQTDIAMAMRSICWAGSHDDQWQRGALPSRFKDLALYCGSEVSTYSRPEDAWSVQETWKKLAEEEFGPKRFIPLEIPVS